MPQVSIIVPIYNSENWLESCVQSVLNQSRGDWELILVDDGSTDSSRSICEQYSQKYEHIRVYSQENAGVSSARNLGISRANGKYIAFLDSDDVYHPEFLARMLKVADTGAIPVCKCTQYESEIIPATREEMLDALLSKRLEGPIFNGFLVRFLFDREIIRAKGIQLAGRYLEDEVFLLEYLIADKRGISLIDDVLYIYNVNTNSATRKHMRGFSEIFADVFERKKKIVAANPEIQKLISDSGYAQTQTWAGYLIAVSNVFAPGGDGKVRTLKTLADSALFREAIRAYKPKNVVSRNKRLVISLTRLRLFWLISLLYKIKNR
ncbi:MAG: glycosyltransferase [Oscillospiraceae bacterium]|jgi:glycosyltransferase involved in cell wall biosynthesis|nr:glycosyltransferase [Oscillospiraceae bacterium]